MPITINGSGTLTGISAGGLPDASIVTADIADANITAAKLDGAQTGSAPIYGCRAWVNFDGTKDTTGATSASNTNRLIRASGNVTSVLRNGAGDYTITFTTAMPDANYCFNLSANDNGTGTGGPAQADGYSYGAWKRGTNSCVYNTGSMRFQIGYPANADLYDQTHINVAIFR